MATNFFDLPAELRNEIYDYVAPDCQAVWLPLHPIDGVSIFAMYPLSYANHQFMHEFSSRVEHNTDTTPRNILANVVDFDFSALTTFFRDVLRRDPNTIFAQTNPAARGVIVEVQVTKDWTFNPDLKKLLKWLDFLKQDVRRNGLAPHVHYHFVDSDEVKVEVVRLLSNTFRRVHPIREAERELFLQSVLIWRNHGAAGVWSRRIAYADKVDSLRRGELEEDVYDDELDEKLAQWRNGQGI
jgi:hypothetical protein